ncbi:hypothetical protein CYMTET_30613 [Cymbomonas tetramitiformis]|uniref:Uncharacterized protein n=1 Tax=Cymbomonas tetramitiformis TaxID=36881 RepID=A0AAE0FIH8_9CHLO|nr:hypothetical protein CYMTET_30613 [Cymbomonas tetramitiformis]
MSYHKLRPWRGPPNGGGKNGSKKQGDSLTTARPAAFDIMLDDARPDDGHHVIVAFKVVDEENLKNEHYLNRWAIFLTAPQNDNIPGIFPSGRICHVELIMQVRRNEYNMYSINMMEGHRDPNDGTVKYEWGRVHARSADPAHLHGYQYTTVQMPRAKQVKMHKFLHSQIGAPFNFPGYALNYTTVCKVGQTYGPRINLAKKHRFTCAELVWAALQIGELEDTDNISCRRMSPNALFDFTRSSVFCSSCSNPFAYA